MNWAVLPLCMLILSGCAAFTDPHYMTFMSDPPGATILVSGRPIGAAPVRIQIRQPDGFLQGRCERFDDRVTANWPSGASASADSVTICPRDGPSHVVYLRRPNVPGAEIDANYAASVRPASVAVPVPSSGPDPALVGAGAALLRGNPPPPPPPAPVRCYSSRMGNTVQTTCY